MEPFFHYLIPLAFLVFFFPQYRKIALYLSPLSFLPDLDWLFPEYHRLILNNIFLGLLIGLLFYFWKGKEWGWIAAYYIFVHVLFDLGNPSALLWPLSSTMYFITFNIYEPIAFDISLQTITHQELLQSAIHGHGLYMSTEGFFFVLLWSILIIIQRKRIMRWFSNDTEVMY